MRGISYRPYRFGVVTRSATYRKPFEHSENHR
jgi:hypothetical protein